MSEVCGASSTIAKEFTKSSQKGKALYLTKDNINILCERFHKIVFYFYRLINGKLINYT